MNRFQTTRGAAWCLGALVATGNLQRSSGTDWPEFRGPERAGIWNADGLVENFDGLADPLPRVWSSPVGAGYSGPTVAGDAVYLMDRGEADQEDSNVERVLSFDRATGERNWAFSYAAPYADVGYAYGPRSSVTIRDGKAFSLGMMGHLHCLDVSDGNPVWSKDLAAEYRVDMPIWGLASSPLVEGSRVIVQAAAKEDGACVVAFDTKTGEEVWRAFDDKASYVSPVVIEQAGERVLVVWTGERVAGMDPATGEVHWEVATPFGKWPINVPGPAFNHDATLMFLSTFQEGSRLVELDQSEPAAKELWHRQGINERKTEAIHNMISPPYFHDGYIYGIDSYGQLRCLDPETGERVWENTEAIPQGRWGTGFMVRNGDRTWIVSERGDLVVARLTPDGYEEIDRARLLEPTTPLKQRPEGAVLWSHPAFAGTRIFARNDRELVCVDLSRPAE
ncbi:MAG: PQQ-binding-like beta-propeller repeat protein [Verrucomicrobiales bacterium]